MHYAIPAIIIIIIIIIIHLVPLSSRSILLLLVHKCLVLGPVATFMAAQAS
jgi:hypothetical protein